MELKKVISDLQRQLDEVNEVISTLERLAACQSPKRGKPATSATRMSPSPLEEPQPASKSARAVSV
jgi:hypothetical protein